MALRFFGKACLRAVHRAQPRMACARNLSQESFEVEHDSVKREFFIKLGKDKAVLQYEVIDSKTLDLVHTEVPESLQGKGIAKHLAKAAFDYLVHEDLQARLSCTYLVKYWNETKSPEHTKHILCA
ncbi:protein NATD1 [Rhipicephalus microplus]|uniref:protein NATD1 n=1 Tax=Rhipicephalus microplus TaxID=6941 RepID=UPI003F6AEDB1